MTVRSPFAFRTATSTRQTRLGDRWVAGVVTFLWIVTALFAVGQSVLLIGPARWQGDVVAPADFIGSLVVAVALAGFGGLIALRGDSARYGWLMLGLGASLSAIQLAGLYSLYLVGAGEPPMSVAVWVQDLWMVPFLLAFLLLPAWFPDGTPATPRWRLPVRLAAAGWITLITVFALADRPATNVFEEIESGPANPIGFLPVPMAAVQAAWAALVLVSIAIGIGSLVTRWRRADAELRQRFKWMLLSLGLISILVGLNLINALFEEAGVDLGLSVLLGLLLSLAQTVLAVTLGFAVLRFRLYNVDLVISRTIVYGILTVVIVATYIGVVVGVGALLPIEQTSLALIATGLAAVAFAPLRDRLQGWVNRWLFGQRDNPYGVLAEMGRLMTETGTPEEMLQNLTETVATLLKLPGAAIELEQDGGWTRRAAFGTVADVAAGVVLPLRHQGELVGRLVVMPRSRHEPLTHRDLVLLEDIAHPAGAIARSVRLTMVLQSARERLVMAREEERRRIRRDLHDGLGPALASQTFQLDEVLERLSVDQAGAAAIVETLKEQNQQLVADVRRLVYELRPPALDELGVAGALTAHVTQLGRSGPIAIEVRTVPDPLPSLPAAVEVAAYRIAREAITNTIRHAAASLCTATLEVSAGRLTVSVRDDGTGLGEAPRRGVGLISMRERTEELGGTFETASPETGGTVVVATIPLINGQAQDEVRAGATASWGQRD